MINSRRKQTRVSEQYGFFYVIPRCKRIKRLILRASPKYGNTGSQGKIREFIMKIKRGLSGTPQDSSSIICLWIFINPIQFGTSDKKKFRETQVVPSFAGNRKTSFEDAGRFLVHLGFSVAEVDQDRIWSSSWIWVKRTQQTQSWCPHEKEKGLVNKTILKFIWTDS